MAGERGRGLLHLVMLSYYSCLYAQEWPWQCLGAICGDRNGNRVIAATALCLLAKCLLSCALPSVPVLLSLSLLVGLTGSGHKRLWKWLSGSPSEGKDQVHICQIGTQSLPWAGSFSVLHLTPARASLPHCNITHSLLHHLGWETFCFPLTFFVLIEVLWFTLFIMMLAPACSSKIYPSHGIFLPPSPYHLFFWASLPNFVMRISFRIVLQPHCVSLSPT